MRISVNYAFQGKSRHNVTATPPVTADVVRKQFNASRLAVGWREHRHNDQCTSPTHSREWETEYLTHVFNPSARVPMYNRPHSLPARRFSAVDNDAVFRDAIQGLRRGDFSRLEPLFEQGRGPAGSRPRIIEWYEEGRFGGEPNALAEALTCACFLGRTEVANYLLTQGVDPSTGAGTGLDALHWAANRGQLESVRLLVRCKAPLETRSMYGGTVLGTAVWSAINESRPDHLQIIEDLLDAGARLDEVDYPTGNPQVDAILRRHGAS